METIIVIGDGFFLLEVDAHMTLANVKQFVEGTRENKVRLADLKDYFAMKEKIEDKKEGEIVILGSKVLVKQGIGYLVFLKGFCPRVEYENAVQNGLSRYVLVAELYRGSLVV